MWANICWQLHELWAPPFSCVFINLFLCNLKLRHNSRGWQKSWARVPSVTGLPWPAWCLPPTECCLLLPKCTGWYPMLQDSFPDTVLGTALFLNSKQQHTEHRSTSLEMQIQGECAEFATKQRHLAYSHTWKASSPGHSMHFGPSLDASPQSWTNTDKNKHKFETSPRVVLTPLARASPASGPYTLGARLTERLFHRDCNKLQRKSNMHSMLPCYVCMKKRQKYWSTSEVWRWLPYRLPPKNHTQPTAMPWSFRRSGM